MFHSPRGPFNEYGQLKADDIRRAHQTAAAASNPATAAYASPIGQIPLDAGSAAAFVGAKVFLSAPVVGGTAPDPVNVWSAASAFAIDTDGFFSAAQPDRLTVRRAGYYVVGCYAVLTDDDSGNHNPAVAITMSGTTEIARDSGQTGYPFTADVVLQPRVEFIRAVVGDYFRVVVYVDPTAGMSMHTEYPAAPPGAPHFWVRFLG